MVQTIRKVLVELMFRKIIYLQYGMFVVILVAILGHYADKIQFNKMFDKRIGKVATVHYKIDDTESINTYWWFYNWEKQDKFLRRNGGFVKDECIALQKKLRSYEWDYKYYCNLAGYHID